MRLGLREAIFIMLLLAMPVVAYLFIFAPRVEQHAQARHEIVAKQAKLRQLEEATRSIDDLGREIERLTVAIARFEEKLPAEREVEVILKEVWELAARNKLTPKRVQTDKPVAAADYAELPIKMQIAGDFDGFYQFMLELEKLPRITRTPRIKLTKDASEEGLVQADLVLSIFFEAQDRPPKATR